MHVHKEYAKIKHDGNSKQSIYAIAFSCPILIPPLNPAVSLLLCRVTIYLHRRAWAANLSRLGCPDLQPMTLLMSSKRGCPASPGAQRSEHGVLCNLILCFYVPWAAAAMATSPTPCTRPHPLSVIIPLSLCAAQTPTLEISPTISAAFLSSHAP